MNTKQALKTLHTLAALCGVLALTHPFPVQAQSIASIDEPAVPASANDDDALWNDRFGPPGIADGQIDTIAVAQSGNTYVGGMFEIPSVGAKSIARWDGNRWYALGTGTSMYTDRVHQIATAGTLVYAGGSFKSMGGVTVKGVAQWNGSTWAIVSASLHSM